jgi:hypothetical protein
MLKNGLTKCSSNTYFVVKVLEDLNCSFLNLSIDYACVLPPVPAPEQTVTESRLIEITSGAGDPLNRT